MGMEGDILFDARPNINETGMEQDILFVVV
jgi:hypothetical protein